MLQITLLNRKTVTALHKENIMKLADGLFLESCRDIASKYPSIKYNEIIVDNCCMQLVSKPEQFDVMVSYFTDLVFPVSLSTMNLCCLFFVYKYNYLLGKIPLFDSELRLIS